MTVKNKRIFKCRRSLNSLFKNCANRLNQQNQKYQCKTHGAKCNWQPERTKHPPPAHQRSDCKFTNQKNTENKQYTRE